MSSQTLAQLPLNLWRLHSLKGRYPNIANYLLGASGVSVLYAVEQYWQKGNTQSDIDFRKKQLAKQVYEIGDEELVHPPWNKTNLNQWLYRTVRITGRPIHAKAFYVPRRENGIEGFEYFVPFVTKENEDQSVQDGYIVSLGFIPHQWKSIGRRLRLPDVTPQTFDCFISQAVEVQSGKFFGGNINMRDPSWTHADLDKMAKETNFTNQKEINNFVLERVALDTPIDERDQRHYDVDAGHQQVYPYIKSRPGALYWHNHMPWDWQRRANFGLTSAFVFGSLGAALHFIK